jgi:hypothetical protein
MLNYLSLIKHREQQLGFKLMGMPQGLRLVYFCDFMLVFYKKVATFLHFV